MTQGENAEEQTGPGSSSPAQCSLLATWADVPHSSGLPEESLEDTLKDRGYGLL